MRSTRFPLHDLEGVGYKEKTIKIQTFRRNYRGFLKRDWQGLLTGKF
jgi:hypothetical protein